jgi:hypothetical protein
VKNHAKWHFEENLLLYRGGDLWMADHNHSVCRCSVVLFVLRLWQRNNLLAGTAVSFFVIHTINGIMNFAVKR